MEGHCSTGQSPQWTVMPMEEEEQEEEEEEEEEEGPPNLDKDTARRITNNGVLAMARAFEHYAA